jgi:hypothetical protein
MEPKGAKKGSLVRRLSWIAVGLIILVLGAFISIRLLPGTGTELHLKAVRDAGLPTTLDELDRWLPQVAPSNNAALLILEAADKRVAPSATLDDLLLVVSPARDLGESKEDLETYIRRNKEALKLVHQAAALPSGRYPLNLTNTYTFTHLAEVKALANLLKAETVYHSHCDQPELAFRSVTSGFALARTLGQEPALISELVRIACVAIAVHNLEQLLAVQKFPSDQLASLSQILELAEADSNRGAFHSIVTERAIILWYFNLPMGEFTKVFNPTGAGNNLAEKLRLSAYRLFDIRERDQRLFLEVMENLCRAMTNSYPDALRTADEIDRDIDRRLATGFGQFFIVSPLLHAMHKITGKEAALITRLRCAQTALAIEQYRVAHEGALPKSLDELVPTYLPDLPRDPVAGEPLQFQPMKAGYQISSPVAAVKLKNPRTAVFRVAK